ncbi:protein PRR14L isoform X2 [Sarcophilus harrisii]|uniref:Proline rich 14 like n=2 Tax=Sarcophilus harrisii TaxID=9305 RepID=A0A7N4NZ33_SARHA|nr:protein PRR14L isoform X2 [Sarcophilus harrisii]
MLSSGVETQPISLDASMSAGAQELYVELPVSVSPELPAEFEPSVTPDAKPEASSSLLRTLPLEPQRTHVENCSRDADLMDDGEEPRCCGLAAECPARDAVAAGVLEKERTVGRGEQKSLRNQGKQKEAAASAGRAPPERLAEGQEQPSSAAATGAWGLCQVVLGKRLDRDLSWSKSEDEPEDEPHHTEENQGNVQVTTETLPKPTEEGQGMKVNGTKMISNAEHRNNKVSKSLPPGCIDCPDVDKIMTSCEVSETSTVVSLEPLTSVKPGLTKAPSTEKECETSSVCPSPEGSASLPLSSGEVPSGLGLDHEATDNHQHSCGWDVKSPSETSIPQVKSKKDGVLPLEADPQESPFPLSLACVGSGSISTEECGSGDVLQKTEKAFWTREIPRKEGSASRLAEEEQLQSVQSKSREVLPVNSTPGGEESTPPLKCARDQRGCVRGNGCCIPSPSQSSRSLQQENSHSPSEGDPVKVPSEIQENVNRHEGKRATCPCDLHHDEDTIEESDDLVMQNEESEKTVCGDPSILDRSVGSLVGSQTGPGSTTEKRDLAACSVPDEPPRPVRKVSEVNRVLTQFQMDKKRDLANQPEVKETLGFLKRGVIPFVDGQRSASYEQKEFVSHPAESSEDKEELLCVLSGKKSFNARDHSEARDRQELSLGDNAEEVCKGISEVSPQQANSILEDGDKVIARQQTILTYMNNVKDAFRPGATTCRASSQNHDVCTKAVHFKRVPKNTVGGNLEAMLAVSRLSKEAEHESAQSQGCHSCLQRAENTSEEDVSSEGVAYKSTATSSEAENRSILTSEDMLVPSDLHCPRTESSPAETILNVRHPSGESQLSKEETEDSFQEGKVRNEVASCSLFSRALSKSTLALSHVKPGNFIASSARKGKKLGASSKETALPGEAHPSEVSVSESKLSSNIPNNAEPKDLCCSTESSDVKGINQADGTNKGLKRQSDLNNPVESWSESESSMSRHHAVGIFDVQNTDSHKSEEISKPNKELRSTHKELLTNDLSTVQPSCGLPKKNVSNTSLDNEESTACRAAPAHLHNKLGEEALEMKESGAARSHRRQEELSWLQRDEPLSSDQPQGEVRVPFQRLIDEEDSVVSGASESFNMRPLKTLASCTGTPSGDQSHGGLCNPVSWEGKKLGQAARDSEAHGPKSSLARGIGSVANHEPDAKLSDTMNGRIIEGILPGETQGTTGGPQMNSAFNEKDSLEGSSREHDLGEKAKPEHVSMSADVKVLPKILKNSTMKTKGKKRAPERSLNIDTAGKRDTAGTFQPKLVSSMTTSSFELNLENKMNRRETEEQQGILNNLKVREESEGEMLREEGGEKNSDAQRSHFKRKRMCGRSRTEKAQAVQGCRRLKGGREGTQPKKRGTFSEKEASLNAKPFIGPTTGPVSQDSTSRSHLQRYPHEQSPLKDTIGAEVTEEECLPQTFLKMDDSESSFPTFTRTSQDISGSEWENTYGTFAIIPWQGQSLPSLKKELNVPYHEPNETGRNTNDVQAGIPRKNASETSSVKEHKILRWSSAVPPFSASGANHTPQPKALRRLVLNSTRLEKPTKELALLSKLSVLARKLLTASTVTQELGRQPSTAQLLPVAETYKWLRFKKLQDESPHNMTQLSLRLGDYGCNKTLDGHQPLALYPLEALRAGFLDLMNKMPSLQFNAQIFPISFHMNLDSELTSDSTRIFSEHCSPPESAPSGDPVHPPQPPKWTVSFLMSQGSSGTATFREDAGLGCELRSHAALQTLSPGQAPGSNAITKVRAGCSVLGLHTVLALSSPGCYRIWTRRRSLSSHLPTIQRLFMTQFTQGFKGLRLQASLSNSLFPSLPHSVGRVLSIWSQHGPSACPFEITTLHSKHSKWPPTLGIRNSHAILPHVPLLGMEATPVRTTDSPTRSGSPVSALAPKSCLAFEPVVSVLRLSTSDYQIPNLKELRRVPPVCSSQHSSTTQKESEPEKRPTKVSQIRIRKTIPRPDPNLTPMGLPRPKRLKKKEFSLEEIYTNKNYKSPPASRCLETIFEEPKERNGALISVSQQKRKRVLEFQDFTVPRKRKNRGKIKVTGSFTRAKKAALQSQELDALLIQKLMDLETFLAKEGEDEPASGC